MSLQGPFLVVTNGPATDIVARLEAAAAFPVVECGWPDSAEAMEKVCPAAVLLVTAGPDSGLREISAAASRAEGFVPVIALAEEIAPGLDLSILPLRGARALNRLVAVLRATLRLRTQHAAVLRRMSAAAGVLALPSTDPVEDAVVLVAGRGRSYPALSTAIGERAGLIGALSLETAASYLDARDVDGLVLGDGFNRRTVAEFVERLATDSRFRDLPIATHGDVTHDIEPERLAFLMPAGAEPSEVAGHMLPYARLHAFSSRLKRMNGALDANGSIDPQTGLFTREVFVRNFTHALHDAEMGNSALALARLSFEQADDRVRNDAARLVSRLVRSGDFACRDRDGTILLALTGTDLAAAHVVTRRLASVLKHTMLAGHQERSQLMPSVALAAYRHRDAATSLLARVTPGRTVAAE